MTEKQLVRFYKQKLYHNRSVSARCFDYAALRLAVFIAMYLLVRPRLVSSPAAVFVSLIAVALFCVVMHAIAAARLERFKEKYRAALRLRFIKEQLLILSPLTFAELCKTMLQEKNCRVLYLGKKHGAGVFQKRLAYIELMQNPSEEELCARELIGFYRRAKERSAPQAFLCLCSELSAQAKEFISKMQDVKMEFITERDLVANACKAAISPNEKDLDEMIKKETAAERKVKTSLKSLIFMPEKIKRYAVSGVLLYLMSFFTGYSLYFKVFAVVLLGLSSLTLFYTAVRPGARVEK